MWLLPIALLWHRFLPVITFMLPLLSSLIALLWSTAQVPIVGNTWGEY